MKKRDLSQINEKIENGEANIYTAEEFKKLIWKEKNGIGWFSTTIKEFEKKCEEAQQVMKSLESIKKRLVIF